MRSTQRARGIACCRGFGKRPRRAFAVCWTLVMAVRLQFEGIRCFAEPQDAVIRPITLLVGENSSGKTTFLALCRIAYAIANGMRTAPLFNEYPFWLGAYDQIATHRGGRRGSAESFSVTIRFGDGAGLSSLHYEYASQGGQPVESIWRLESVGLVIQHASHDGRQPSLVIRGPQDKAPRPLAPVLGGATEGPPALWFSLTMGEFDRALGAGVLSQSERDSIGRALKSIQQEFRRLPYAIPPVRTNPRRTYDPISTDPNPEGSHIPMLLASLSRSAQQAPWNALQSALKDFGAKSGLFEEIEIVDKGKKESDPFQVGVKLGHTFNFIDVGYGVSQALHILVDTLLRASPFETFLIQQPEVHVHPRAQAELGTFFARQAYASRRFVIETHSDYLVDRIRMEVRRKLLKPEDVSLLYFERGKSGATIHNLELDAKGSITNPPPGFRQFFLKEERDLLGI